MLKRLLVFLSTFLVTPTLFAGVCYGNLIVDAEFLYLLPTFDDTYFVIQNDETTTFPAGRRLNNDFHFRPGFRVGLANDNCGCGGGWVAGYYTRLKASKTKTVTGDFLWATLGNPVLTNNFTNYTGSAFSHLNCLYQSADAFYGNNLFCNKSFIIDGTVGLEFGYLRLSEHYNYERTLAFANIYEKARTWGVGPQFGIDFTYLSCVTSWYSPGQVSIVASTAAALLMSKTHIRNQTFLNTTTIEDICDANTWRVVPVMHASLGINYYTTFCFGWASLEIGYEFNAYIRGLARLSFPDDIGRAFCVTDYYNFDIQGLYIALNVGF